MNVYEVNLRYLCSDVSIVKASSKIEALDKACMASDMQTEIIKVMRPKAKVIKNCEYDFDEDGFIRR